MNFLVGYFSRRKVFHIVRYEDTQIEVDAYLKIHPSSKLVVYRRRATDETKADPITRDGSGEEEDKAWAHLSKCGPNFHAEMILQAMSECPHCHIPLRR